MINRYKLFKVCEKDTATRETVVPATAERAPCTEGRRRRRGRRRGVTGRAAT